MDWREIQKHWDLYQRGAQRRWLRIGFGEWQAINGDLDRLIDRIQILYRLPRTLAEQEVEQWLATLDEESLACS